MKTAFHKNFHLIDKIPPAKDANTKMFIIDSWKPSSDIYLIGCAIGLLCLKTESFELYCVVSKNPELKPEKYLVGLKKDWLFYQHRDVYSYSSGINDLISYHFLPEGCGFFIKKGESIYIKGGVMNLSKSLMYYDILCNLYFVRL